MILEERLRYAEWESREELEKDRIIPYGIPNEIYYAMLFQQFHPVGKGTLFPEHAEFAK